MKLSFVNNLNKLIKFRNSGENITNNNEKVKLIIIDANDETVQKKTEKVIV